MNFIERESERCDFVKFRERQLQMVPQFIENTVNYLRSLGGDLPVLNIKKTPALTYKHLHYNALEIYTVRTYEDKDIKEYLKIAVPKLIDGTFFILADVKYVPAVYTLDEPITIKKSSIKLNSLFCPITIYFKNKRAIILKHNIAADSLLQFYFGYQKGSQLGNELGLKHFRHQSNVRLENQFMSLFKCSSREEVIKTLDKLFFDEWTKELYQKFYGIENPTLKETIKLAVEKLHQKSHFTDLRYKRLVFLELLMRPVLQATSYIARRIIEKTVPSIYLNVKQDDIIKCFIKFLNANFFYDTVNGFTSILAHKISFKNPFGSGVVPTEISSIHESHKNKICPVSISNTKPGETVSLVPNIKIDFKHGIFEGV